MNNYQNWLETPDIVRVLLVHVEVLSGGTLVTRYLSTHAAANHLPIIKNSVSIEESISTQYAASISYGDIEIANHSGEYDSWLYDIWRNKSIKIYTGTLPTDSFVDYLQDFELIFDGVVEDIDSKDRNTLNLKIRDKLEKLNTSISENLLGNYFQGTTVSESTYVNQYRNNLRPLVFGEVHNITPMLIDSTTLEYMCNDGPVEQIIEVRDNGIPVSFGIIQDPQTGITPLPGSFRLLQSPIGAVTCSVQGIKRTINETYDTFEYKNTAANTIATILKFYGRQLDYSEIDYTSFNILGQEAVGVYIQDRVNILSICQDIAKSCGLVLSVSRAGKVKLIDITIPNAASVNITDSDMLINTLQLTEKANVIAGIKLGYAKNWTVQSSLLTAIPQLHKDLYSTEWLEAIQIDTTTKELYSVSTEPVLEGTYLIDKADADSVALKKLDLFKVPRKTFKMICTAKFLSLQVGDAVSITASRFGLSGGVFGRVIQTKPDWLRGRIEIGVLV